MKKLNYIIITILVLTFNSCELIDSLDELPPDQLVEENLFVSVAAAEATLNGTYEELLENGYFGVITFPASMSSNLENSSIGGITSVFENTNDFELTDFYRSIYTMADRANNVIQGVSSMDDALFENGRKNEILGEAYFLRAMAHFDALRFFGHHFNISSEYGAILREAPVNLDNIVKARSNVLESYNLILSDLDFAIANAPQNINQIIFANKFTAQALKSRVQLYLAAADNHNSERYMEAIDLANEALFGGFILENDYQTIFSGASPEVIFETFEPQRPASQNRILRAFSPENRRFEASQSFVDFMQSDLRIGNYVNTESNGFNTIIKYEGRDVLFLFRAAELVLIIAESHARLGNDDMGLDYLNLVRQTRGLPPFANESGDILLALIYDEIRRDLSFENGHEWFSLVRQGLNAVNLASPDIDSENFMALPIPTVEVQNNSLMDQNPGYQTTIVSQ